MRSLVKIAAGTGLTYVDAPNTQKIGSFAFGGCQSLKTVVLGGITEMGEGIFLTPTSSGYYVGLTSLESVVFGEGTTEISAFALAISDINYYAYYGGGSSSLVSVTIPSTVTKIDSGAFLGRTKLTNTDEKLNLSNVKEIGIYAFYGCESLADVDLSGIVTIGNYAFYGTTALTEANLASAKTIGNYAFCNSGLQTLTISAAEVLGSYAFAQTNITTVQIPKTMSSATYNEVWQEENDAGDMEDVKGKMSATFGSGVFQDCKNLTSITVETGNDVFFVDDNGALYQKAIYSFADGTKYGEGYVLLCYPVASTATEYSVLENTVRIGDSAFYGATNLQKIVLPSTLKSIGSMAFYGVKTGTEEVTAEDGTTSTKRNGVTFEFKSAQAPTLETTYVSYNSTYVKQSDILTYLLSFPMTNNSASNAYLSSTVYYATFGDFVAPYVEANRLKSNMLHAKEEYGTEINQEMMNYVSSDLGLNIIYPQNGSGYDNIIWQAYFPDASRKTSSNAVDSNTLDAINKIAALKSAEEVRAMIDAIEGTDAKLEAILNYSENVVAVAREAYNLVTDSVQLSFVTDASKLLAVEAEVRTIRAELNQPVELQELKITSQPTKYEYDEGETFDPTGMVVVAIYADGSRVTVQDYTLDVTDALTTDVNYITVSYGGKEAQIYIAVNKKSDPTPTTYTVSFSGDGVSVSSQTVEQGATATKPADPTRDGYTFEYWYLQGTDGSAAYDFATAVTSNITLVAKWKQNSDQPVEPVDPQPSSQDGWKTFLWIVIAVVVVGAAVAVAVLKKEGAADNNTKSDNGGSNDADNTNGSDNEPKE